MLRLLDHPAQLIMLLLFLAVIAAVIIGFVWLVVRLTRGGRRPAAPVSIAQHWQPPGG
ncbi:hypothetical protein [Kineosporia sp. A_224]|uniref:hypothetical protein n=1 Tax=Kineosporia sp. A_224 TaxID=1962180 RepID=UPI0013042520|nr:hypothetical protein [Kineosporia sp. A_224]